MLLGMAGFKTGFLTGDWERPPLPVDRRWIAIAIGAVASAAIA